MTEQEQHVLKCVTNILGFLMYRRSFDDHMVPLNLMRLVLITSDLYNVSPVPSDEEIIEIINHLHPIGFKMEGDQINLRAY